MVVQHELASLGSMAASAAASSSRIPLDAVLESSIELESSTATASVNPTEQQQEQQEQEEDPSEPERSLSPRHSLDHDGVGMLSLGWGGSSTSSNPPYDAVPTVKAAPEAHHEPALHVVVVEKPTPVVLSPAEQLAQKVARALESIDLGTSSRGSSRGGNVGSGGRLTEDSSPRSVDRATKKRVFVDQETERVSNIMFGLLSGRK
jgi:hypothetical protein